MTSQKEAPGAAAVYLYREEMTDDALHMRSFYVRLKVLTEAGKDYANVRLSYESDVASNNVFDSDFGFSVTDVAGRTIHSDGTIIPFTGKPYERTVEKTRDLKVTQKVFTLPDVEVGSIIEYRYKMRIPDQWFQSPNWYIQQDLYLRKGYFYWKATDEQLTNELTGGFSLGIAYSAVLPAGFSVQNTAIPAIGTTNSFHKFELSVHDIPPMPEEEYMPPVRSFTYRVNFYYAYDRSQDDFWKNQGKAWAKKQEHFMGSPDSMSAAVKTLVAPGDGDTVKLQKIYAAVMAMDNTIFSRQHASSEDRAQGLSAIKSTEDIWQRKRGTDDELTLLFIALARAAGMKAYVMRVTARDENMFSPGWLTMSQLEDDVAIVVVNAKEQYFDPGQRDCPFGQMAWKHTDAGGVRETDGGGTALGTTPPQPYIQTQTQRVADLTMEPDGMAHGIIKITWMGAPALQWRQDALRKDEGSVKHAMQEWLTARIPAGMEPEITTIANLDDYEKPLIANFNVHGPLATVTAKRLILPGEFFEANSKPLFPHPTRDIAVYFQHGGRTIDAARVKFPDGLQVESVPKEDSFTMQQLAAYHAKPELGENSILMRRTFDLGVPFFLAKEYPDVRTFYNKIAADDQQPVVLLTAAAASSSATETKSANDPSH